MTDYILSIKQDGQRPANISTQNKDIVIDHILATIKKYNNYEIHLKVSDK